MTSEELKKRALKMKKEQIIELLITYYQLLISKNKGE